MEFTKALGEALLVTCSVDADTKTLQAATAAVAELSKGEPFAAAAADLIKSNLEKPLALAAASALKNAATVTHTRDWLKKHLFALLDDIGDKSSTVRSCLLECAAVVSAKSGWPELVKQLGERLIASKSTVSDIAFAMEVIRSLHGDDGALGMLAPALFAVVEKCVRSWSEAKEKKDSDAVAKILLSGVTTLVESTPLVEHVKAQQDQRAGWTKMIPLALAHPKSKINEPLQSMLWRALAAVAVLDRHQAAMCLEHALTTTLAHADIMMWLVGFAAEQKDMFVHKAATPTADTKAETKKRKTKTKERSFGRKRARMGLGGEKTVVDMDEEDEEQEGKGTQLLDMVFRQLIGPAMLAKPEEYRLFRLDPARFLSLELDPTGLSEDTKQFLHGHPISSRISAQHLCAMLFRDHGPRMLQLVRIFVQRLCENESTDSELLVQEAMCALMTTIPEWNSTVADFVDMRLVPLIVDAGMWMASIPRAFLLCRILKMLMQFEEQTLSTPELPVQLCAAVTSVGDRTATALFGRLLSKWMPRLNQDALIPIVALCQVDISSERHYQNEHVAQLLTLSLSTLHDAWFRDKEVVTDNIVVVSQAINAVRARQPDGPHVAMYPHWLVAALSVLLTRGGVGGVEGYVSKLLLAMLNKDSLDAYGVYAFHIASIMASMYREPPEGEVKDPAYAEILKGLVHVWTTYDDQKELQHGAFLVLAQFARRLGSYMCRGVERLGLLSQAIAARMEKFPKEPEATTLASLLVLHLPPARLSKLMPDWMKLHLQMALESKQSAAVGHTAVFALACVQRLGLASGDFQKLCDGCGKDTFAILWTKMIVPCMRGEYKIDPQHAPLVASALKHMTSEAEWKAAPDFVRAAAELIKTAMASASQAPKPADGPLALPFAPSLFS